MLEPTSLMDVIHRTKKYLVLSLVVSFMLVPVVDIFVIERDRNRNMVYGELFWQEGLAVYELSDRDLNETYGVPEDHLLTDVLNVTYEYPIVTLLFFASLAAIEPGMYGTHWIVNWVMLIFHHLNVLLFVFIGRKYWEENWMKQMTGAYYLMGLVFSIALGNFEPFADLFWLASLTLLKDGRYIEANVTFGLAAQVKVYPVILAPIFITASPQYFLVFLLVQVILYLPMILSGIGYTSMLSHLISSEGYASIITNPFYAGFTLSNPISIIAPLVLVFAFVYAVTEHKEIRGIPVPTTRLKLRERRSLYFMLLPLTLVAVSWVLMWYYLWFLIPVLMLKENEAAPRYRWVWFAIWVAHFVGVLVNFDYFLAGPIAEFFSHIQ